MHKIYFYVASRITVNSKMKCASHCLGLAAVVGRRFGSRSRLKGLGNDWLIEKVYDQGYHVLLFVWFRGHIFNGDE